MRKIILCIFLLIPVLCFSQNLKTSRVLKFTIQSASAYGVAPNDTFSITAVVASDQLGQAYNGNQIDTSDVVTDQLGRRFYVETITSQSSESFTGRVVQMQSDNFQPFGKGIIAAPTNNNMTPAVPDNPEGITPALYTRILNHNILKVDSLLSTQSDDQTLSKPDTDSISIESGNTIVDRSLMQELPLGDVTITTANDLDIVGTHSYPVNVRDATADNVTGISYKGAEYIGTNGDYSGFFEDRMYFGKTGADVTLESDTWSAANLINARLGNFNFNTNQDTSTADGYFLGLQFGEISLLPVTGDVAGPGSSTDNAIARFDGTTGKLIQDSGWLIDDGDTLRAAGNIDLGGYFLSPDGSDIGLKVDAEGDLYLNTNTYMDSDDVFFAEKDSSYISLKFFNKDVTTTPSPFLSLIDGDGYAFAFGVGNDNTTFSYDNGAYFRIKAQTRANIEGNALATSGSADVLRLDGNAAANSIRVNSTGVGILNASAAYPLDVTGDAAFTGEVYAESGILNLNSVGDVLIQTNAGTPESVVTADPGSLVLDTSNGILYIKETGIGSTGWVKASSSVVGAASSTDNAIVRFDGVSGDTLQNSAVTIDDSGNVDLLNTTFAAQSGIITKNGSRFIHDFNYGNNGTVTTVGRNLFIGEDSGNLTMGSSATFNYESSENTAIAYQSLYNNERGYRNISIGALSGYSNTTGASNTYIGYSSGYSNASGSSSVYIGAYSLYSKTSGSKDIAIGANAGRYQTGGVTPVTTSSNSIFLGADTKSNGNNESNQIVIGQNTTGNGSNTVTIGNSSITDNFFTGELGIGVTPIVSLDASGDAQIRGGTIGFDATSAVKIATNAGTPESVVTADPGSLVLDTSNGVTYIKNTGTGSTGWLPNATGASSSTDNAIVRFNGTGGTALQSSDATIDDLGQITTTGLTVEAETASTTGSASIASFRRYSTGDMSSTFGMNIPFYIGDNTLASQQIAYFLISADGADDNGQISFATYNGGFPQTALRLDTDQNVELLQYDHNLKSGAAVSSDFAIPMLNANGTMYRFEVSNIIARMAGGSASFTSGTDESIAGDVAPSTAAEISGTSDWAISNDSLVYTGTETRFFSIIATVDGDGSAAGDYSFSIAKNGTVETASTITGTVLNANDKIDVMLLYGISLTTNDVIQIFVDVDAGSPTFTNENTIIKIEPFDN